MGRIAALTLLLVSYILTQSCSSISPNYVARQQGVVTPDAESIEGALPAVVGVKQQGNRGLQVTTQLAGDVLVKFDLFDLDGQTIFSGEKWTNAQAAVLLPIDLRQLDPGAYLLRTVAANSIEFHRLQIK